MDQSATGDWRQLLRLLLAQRLELNAIESALTGAGVLTPGQVRDIRTQAADTAKAWSTQEGDDVLRLLRIHATADATMLVPPPKET